MRKVPPCPGARRAGRAEGLFAPGAPVTRRHGDLETQSPVVPAIPPNRGGRGRSSEPKTGWRETLASARRPLTGGPTPTVSRAEDRGPYPSDQRPPDRLAQGLPPPGGRGTGDPTPSDPLPALRRGFAARPADRGPYPSARRPKTGWRKACLRSAPADPSSHRSASPSALPRLESPIKHPSSSYKSMR